MFHEAGAPLVLSLLFVGCSAVQPSPSPNAQLNTSVRSLRAGQVVDGVPCLTEDLPQHHIHVHLLILYHGTGVTVPAGIGVGRPWGMDSTGFIATGGCFAWIHTHDTTGVVHIVTPEEKSFTLGQLFEVWGHPLAADSALGYDGPPVMLVNGRRFDGDLRAARLVNLESIVLELGEPPAIPPPALYNFSGRRL
jgi:hypothetical protein